MPVAVMAADLFYVSEASVSITSNSFKAELNDKGWRLTPQRETILQVFQTLPSGEHLSVEDVHEVLAEGNQGISLSTIYRTVKLMARMGILRELELAEGHKHYEMNQAGPHHHHHMVCVQCSRTIEFNNDLISKQSLKQVEKSGLHLIDCQLTIYMICPEAIRHGFPALPMENWMCSRAIAAVENAKAHKPVSPTTGSLSRSVIVESEKYRTAQAESTAPESAAASVAESVAESGQPPAPSPPSASSSALPVALPVALRGDEQGNSDAPNQLSPDAASPTTVSQAGTGKTGTGKTGATRRKSITAQPARGSKT